MAKVKNGVWTAERVAKMLATRARSKKNKAKVKPIRSDIKEDTERGVFVDTGQTQQSASSVSHDVVFPPRTEEEKITALVSQVSKRTVNHVASVVFRALDEAFAKIYKGE